MAVPVSYRNLLKSFASDIHNPAWARDLVCLAISTDGAMTDKEKQLIWEECENGISAPSRSIPPGINDTYPKVELLKLVHHHGVNQLANNQEIAFCEEGITLLYGQNRSGKSGYFRILNQLASGSINYQLFQDVYNATPPAESISVDFKTNGAIQPSLNWNGSDPSPVDLRHIRCFDSKYAMGFLQPREGNTYLFESYNLRVFRAIHDTVRFIKNDLNVPIDPVVEGKFSATCTVAYRDKLSQALLVAFRDELKALGMDDLKVDLVVDDLLAESSKIALRISSGVDINSVLSEAELKCAALALFLAECELMEVKQPIVFDDPVNSLDAQIIQNFAERIVNLAKTNQVIIFTHNDILMYELIEHKDVTVFKNPTIHRSSPKVHLLAYDVCADINAKGYIMPHEKRKSDYFLDLADRFLHVTPFLSSEPTIIYLRRAIEELIDEKVFNNLTPLRFRGHNANIEWLKMENMVNAGASGVTKIRDLRRIHDRLSGRGVHSGVLPTLSQAELITLLSQLRAIV